MYCNNKSIPAALLFLDFEKAFDCLDWQFIQNCLTLFNFGPQLKKWVSTLYSNLSSCVSNNGFLSAYFQVTRGVRQGCPLRPYLFIICTEILNILIKSNNLIKGVEVSDVSIKISQYADDTVVITDGSNSSLTEVHSTLLLFSSVSGLTINMDKSNVFLLGHLSKNPPHYLNMFSFKVCDMFKYLGVTFSHHMEDFFQLNYLPKLSRLKHILNLWSSRDITPIGRIVLIKTFAISQLVFLFSVLPNPPDHFIKTLNEMFYKFIWSNKRDKVSRSVMCNTKNNGGLKMINLLFFCNSLKCKWVKQLLDDSFKPWKVLFTYELKKYGSSFLFKCNFAKNDVCISNLFIRQVCDAWADYNFHIPSENFSDQFILNNSCLKINGEIFFHKDLLQCNVFKVLDFFENNGKVKPFDNFISNLHLSNFSFIHYFSIVDAIPSSWKRDRMNPSLPNVNEVRLIKFSIANKPSVLIYNDTLSRHSSMPKAIQKWNHLFSDSTFNWNAIYALPFRVIRKPKVQYLQFRLLHRIIGVNSYLFRLKVKDSPLCSFCNEEEETIEHLFWNCPISNSFWFDCISNCLKEPINLNAEVVLFGLPNIVDSPVNFFLLYKKYFIFNCKCNNINPEITVFRNKFQFILQVEKFILAKNSNTAGIDLLNDYFSHNFA